LRPRNIHSKAEIKTMLIRRIAWLICGLAALAALAIGLRAMTTSASLVTVEWTTASELNTAGFNLYRSESRDGSYTRINSELIPHSPDPQIGGSYSFTDTNVVAGRTYYYQLEDVETGGATTRHGPIEVKAERNNSTELFLAAVLFGGALVGAMFLYTSKR
jgi:hypothetical protein